MAEQTESSWTESRFRQRLVGASVVVALAVLLLPLWLDGSGIDSLRVQSAPEKPKVEGAERIEVPQPPGETGEPLQNPPSSLFPNQTPIEAREQSESGAAAIESDASPSEESEIEAAAALEEMAEDDDPSAAAREPEAAAGSDRQVESEPKPAESKTPAADDPSGDVESAAQEAEPASPAGSLPESSASGEYVVQLGSFSDERNARALAKSVESSGFDVSVTPLFSQQGTVWRVRVGPYATRDLAGEATERLRQRIGRDGLVMTK
ncbi:SPOR domain-containing protein [Guyparkeria halophila]|uniref:SPOR domain-containing protein n=1 Tax=Guyparkeria halophila TaxID=47960 RepID=A0ABZ0YT21_9GAMM|nr:SPOR domain-containing protein [Guyparkeria halophila]WQH15315.1 SPOR domain-containing protein [Guyparkeria halophila]